MRAKRSNARSWCERMRLGGYQHAWVKWNNGTVEIVQNSKVPGKLLHIVYAGEPFK